MFQMEITSGLRLATQQQEAYLKSIAGTISGTVADSDAKKGQPKVS